MISKFIDAMLYKHDVNELLSNKTTFLYVTNKFVVTARKIFTLVNTLDYKP